VFSEDDKTRERSKELFDKVRAGTASDAEQEEHSKIRKDRINRILAKGVQLFNKSEIKTPPPEKARIFSDFICENCGEPAMLTRVCELGSNKYCIPCCKKMQTKK
jgi:formylmethanofuran dehydrogenase subunit E